MQHLYTVGVVKVATSVLLVSFHYSTYRVSKKTDVISIKNKTVSTQIVNTKVQLMPFCSQK